MHIHANVTFINRPFFVEEMNWLLKFIDIILHLDTYMGAVLQTYGTWTYVLLFIVVFCETGLVLTPFLPGDSLLFTAGLFAAQGSLDLYLLMAILFVAAVLGDTVNYWIGNIIGPKIFSQEHVRFLNKKHLDKTHAFYEKYGGKTIIFARFIPIMRTFAPFVAGIGKMTYSRFLLYNLLGGAIWVTLFTLGGYYFGNIPIVKNNFTAVIMLIIVASFVPMVIEYIKHYLQERKTLEKQQSAP